MTLLLVCVYYRFFFLVVLFVFLPICHSHRRETRENNNKRVKYQSLLTLLFRVSSLEATKKKNLDKKKESLPFSSLPSFPLAFSCKSCVSVCAYRRRERAVYVRAPLLWLGRGFKAALASMPSSQSSLSFPTLAISLLTLAIVFLVDFNFPRSSFQLESLFFWIFSWTISTFVCDGILHCRKAKVLCVTVRHLALII